MGIGFIRFSSFFALILSLSCAEMQNFDLSQVFSIGAPPDEMTVANGLKQALEVGTQRTTTTLSAPGGFGSNPRLRLRLPGEMGTLASAFRRIGLGARVDTFEDSMNRAAEEAAARAVPVFSTAITSMSIADAFEILNGPDNAATVYFQERTSASLRREFSPVAASAMQEVGLYRAYREIVARYDAIPFTKPPALDLEAYITDQTLSALFAELALEEARIREDPAARSTALLRRVFGSVTTSPASPGTTPGSR
jgi:hypothetical protein